MAGNYDKLVERIAKSSGLEKEEIERRVEAKRAKLSGLISREGAAQVIAAELGINFDNEILKIEELVPGMRKVNTLGKVIRLFPIRSFTTKKGDQSKVANIIVADETSNIKVVLWDTNHISLIETGRIGEGTVIEISNGSMRENEVHVGSFSDIKPSEKIILEVKTEKPVKEKVISEFKQGDSVTLRAFIVQVFDPRFFNVCLECKKKVTANQQGFVCEVHGSVAPEKRALMNLVIDDGTETIRAVVFNDLLPSLGIKDLENPERLAEQRQDLLGKEFILSGNVRNNSYFNTLEFIIDKVEAPNLDLLIQKMSS